nr:type II CAAX endopeptidase family protein [Stakelama flava]
MGNARIVAPGRLRWLRAIGWMVLLAVLVIFTFGLISGGLVGVAASRAGIEPADVNQTIVLLSTILGALVATSLYAALVGWGEKRRASELKLRFFPFEVALGLAIGAAMMAAAVAIAWTAGWMTVTAVPVQTVTRAVSESIQSGVMEEVLFRLVILRLLWRAFGIWPALGLSALIFGLVHLGNPNASLFAALCIAVEAGVMLATFYILTGRVWVSVGVHAGWNFTQGWIFGAAVSGTDGFAGGPLLTRPAADMPHWLSGGTFGPEASLAGLIVGTGVGAYTLWLARQKGRLGEGAAAPVE